MAATLVASEINQRTTGAARSEVSGVQEFIQRNADLQKQKWI